SLGDNIRFERIEPTDAPPFPEFATASDDHRIDGQLDILVSGLQTTVQDLGRYGYGRMGFAPNGAADRAGLLAANRLVGNPDDAAALEMTLSGPTLRFRRRTVIALCGAEMQALLNGIPLPHGRSHGVMPGDELVVRSVA